MLVHQRPRKFSFAPSAFLLSMLTSFWMGIKLSKGLWISAVMTRDSLLFWLRWWWLFFIESIASFSLNLSISLPLLQVRGTRAALLMNWKIFSSHVIATFFTESMGYFVLWIHPQIEIIILYVFQESISLNC